MRRGQAGDAPIMRAAAVPKILRHMGQSSPLEVVVGHMGASFPAHMIKASSSGAEIERAPGKVHMFFAKKKELRRL